MKILELNVIIIKIMKFFEIQLRITQIIKLKNKSSKNNENHKQKHRNLYENHQTNHNRRNPQ